MHPFLLPAPRQLELHSGECSITPGRLIAIVAANPLEHLPTALRFQTMMQQQLSFTWEIVAGAAAPPYLTGLILRVDPEDEQPPQGYRIDISPLGLQLRAHDQAGAFYAIATLAQLVEQYGAQLPCLSIVDRPDFPVRGVMLDVSRDKVPKMETLYSLVDMLAGWKINQLQLYTEHTFAYRQYPEVWANASPFTGQEILELDAFCRERSIELVPNQNSFGHMHRWLTHPRFAPLAEVQAGFQAPWGYVEGTNSLCPVDPGSLALVASLYDELLPHFNSRMINVGCDETFDLGQGRSREACERLGSGQVYLEFLSKVYAEVAARGHTMQYWGDIVIQHPDLIRKLPKDAIALEWGYEAEHPFGEHGAQFSAAGIPFYVCPGTSAWCSIAGRSNNALANLLNAAENGRRWGACGYLITDWGDHGHWQPLPVSFLGFAAGAAYSWALDANRALDIPQALNRYAFHDRAGQMGCLANNLGNVYQAAKVVWVNASPLFSILQRPFSQLRDHPKIRSIPYGQVLEAIDSSMSGLTAADPLRPDRALILREFSLAARLLRHACRRGQLAAGGTPNGEDARTKHVLDLDMQALLCDYEQVWLERNRPGGLTDSLARLENTRLDYSS